jgi:hypothetical protein
MTSKTWRQSIARTLRDLAYWLDPPSKPGPRKRKARTSAEAPLLYGFPQEIEEPRA